MRGHLIRALCATTVLLVAGIALALRLSEEGIGPELGSTPAGFVLPVVKGPTPRASLAGYRGRPVVVEVFASWCEYCEETTAVLTDVFRARRQAPVAFLAVSLDDSPFEAASAIRGWPIAYDVAFDDGTVAKDWMITAVPTTVVLDSVGRVHYVARGVPDEKRLERKLAELGAGRID